MKKTRPLSAALAAILVGGVVLAVAVSGGSAKKAQRSAAAGSAVSVKQTSLGKTLVDADGRTLYLFQADKQGVSNLSQAGLAVWPPLTATGTPLASGGASAAAIGTIAGPGTTRQVTYNGHPLYHYVGDKNAGDTHG